jgi:phage-related minor tail protein
LMGSILANIAKLLLQRSILQGLNAAFPSLGLIPVRGAAQGAMFPGGIQAFASGGVVGAPTMFAHAGGLGLMGEAGPEAIVPLKRSSSGNLGVEASPVNVTVINTAGAAVKTEESRGINGERQLRILVQKAVEEGIGGGRFDRVMSTAYGIPRKGR